MKNKVLMTAIVGSHNYNLVSEKSDIDFYKIVLPTLDQLFNNKLANTSQTSEEKDVTTIDIRAFTKGLLNGNPNHIEVLFSSSLRYEAEIASETLSELEELREDIARANTVGLYNAYMGMAINDTKRLDKQVNENSSAKVYYDAYGYNTKVAVNVLRAYETLIRYAENGLSGYGDAIYFDGDTRDKLLRIKNGALGLTELKELIERKRGIAEGLRELYYGREKDKETLEVVKDKMQNVFLLEMWDNRRK